MENFITTEEILKKNDRHDSLVSILRNRSNFFCFEDVARITLPVKGLLMNVGL